MAHVTSWARAPRPAGSPARGALLRRPCAPPPAAPPPPAPPSAGRPRAALPRPVAGRRGTWACVGARLAARAPGHAGPGGRAGPPRRATAAAAWPQCAVAGAAPAARACLGAGCRGADCVRGGRSAGLAPRARRRCRPAGGLARRGLRQRRRRRRPCGDAGRAPAGRRRGRGAPGSGRSPRPAAGPGPGAGPGARGVVRAGAQTDSCTAGRVPPPPPQPPPPPRHDRRARPCARCCIIAAAARRAGRWRRRPGGAPEVRAQAWRRVWREGSGCGSIHPRQASGCLPQPPPPGRREREAPMWRPRRAPIAGGTPRPRPARARQHHCRQSTRTRRERPPLNAIRRLLDAQPGDGGRARGPTHLRHCGRHAALTLAARTAPAGRVGPRSTDTRGGATGAAGGQWWRATTSASGRDLSGMRGAALAGASRDRSTPPDLLQLFDGLW
jgi:hypothetical protein